MSLNLGRRDGDEPPPISTFSIPTPIWRRTLWWNRLQPFCWLKRLVGFTLYTWLQLERENHNFSGTCALKTSRQSAQVVEKLMLSNKWAKGEREVEEGVFCRCQTSFCLIITDNNVHICVDFTPNLTRQHKRFEPSWWRRCLGNQPVIHFSSANRVTSYYRPL